MSRWQSDARGRLEQAALQLFVERGFEQTTVAEIAKRAGLTERTFFRHFADKREVLFGGAGALQELLVRTLAANAELRERELIKLASLAAALADALRRRGVRDPVASLAAEAGIAVFKIAFERWINDTDQRDLSHLIRESLDELKAVTAGT
jgi:AcrR family transcriptional regulator